MLGNTLHQNLSGYLLCHVFLSKSMLVCGCYQIYRHSLSVTSRKDGKVGGAKIASEACDRTKLQIQKPTETTKIDTILED